MLVDSLIVPECVYRPGSFSGLMTLYESNYLKLDRLLGHEKPPCKQRVSTVPNDCDLHLEVLRAEPYTSTLKLTYWFEEMLEDRAVAEPGGDASPVHAERAGAAGEAEIRLVPDPDLTVRVYHDAALVEAVGGRNTHHHHRVLQALALSHAGELDRRWRVNIMLNKWLDYLLENGHSLA